MRCDARSALRRSTAFSSRPRDETSSTAPQLRQGLRLETLQRPHRERNADRLEVPADGRGECRLPSAVSSPMHEDNRAAPAGGRRLESRDRRGVGQANRRGCWSGCSTRVRSHAIPRIRAGKIPRPVEELSARRACVRPQHRPDEAQVILLLQRHRLARGVAVELGQAPAAPATGRTSCARPCRGTSAPGRHSARARRTRPRVPARPRRRAGGALSRSRAPARSPGLEDLLRRRRAHRDGSELASHDTALEAAEDDVVLDRTAGEYSSSDRQDAPRVRVVVREARRGWIRPPAGSCRQTSPSRAPAVRRPGSAPKTAPRPAGPSRPARAGPPPRPADAAG